jgi:adenosine kinase
MKALICGSLAYDTIMVFQDQFKNHILPDKVHILNVSFLVPRMRKEFGGCAGNISYNLKLLDGHPVPMGTVGQDFGPYREHFTRCGIDLSQVKTIDDLYTAQAFITTDLDDNQITAFHPGAMMRSYEKHVRDVPDIAFGIVGPDGREAMLQHSTEFARHPVHLRSGPGDAAVQRRGTARVHRAGAVRHGQRLRSNLLQQRTNGRKPDQSGSRRMSSRAARKAPDQHGEETCTFRRRTSAACPTRPDAAMPIAPA